MPALFTIMVAIILKIGEIHRRAFIDERAFHAKNMAAQLK